jgi:hypothetical protein
MRRAPIITDIANGLGVPGSSGHRYRACRVAEPEVRIGVRGDRNADAGDDRDRCDGKPDHCAAGATGPH